MTDSLLLDVRSLPSTREYSAYKDGGQFPVLGNVSGDALVAVLRGGAGHLGLNGRIDIIRSLDGGRTWTPPDMLVDSEVDDRNPAFGVAQSGVLMLAYRREGRYDQSGRYVRGQPSNPDERRTSVMLTRSHDAGATWEIPVPLDLPLLRTGSPFGKIVNLGNQMLLLPIYDVYQGHEAKSVPPENLYSYLIRSLDDGANWGDASPIAPMMGETALLALPSGDLLAMMRDRGAAQALWSAHSTDAGYSWSEPVQVTGPMQHPADLVLLNDNSVLLTYGNRNPPYRIEGRISRDGGRSWLPPILTFSGQLYGYNVEADRPYDFGYPSSAILRNVGSGGQGITLYYYNPSIRTQRSERGPESDFYASKDYCARAICWDEDEFLEGITRLCPD